MARNDTSALELRFTPKAHWHAEVTLVLGLVFVAIAVLLLVYGWPGDGSCRRLFGCLLKSVPPELRSLAVAGLGVYLIRQARQFMDNVARGDVWYRIDAKGIERFGAAAHFIPWAEVAAISEGQFAFDLHSKTVDRYRGQPLGKGRMVIQWTITDRTRDEVYRALAAYRPDLAPQDANRTR